MKTDWPMRPLSDVVTSRPGNNKIIKGKQSDSPGAGLIQAFSASGPDVWVTTADYNQPGVVISAVGARCGKTFIADGEWTAIANTHVLLPGKEVDPRWLWYRTNDESFWIKGGAAQPFVKVKDTLQQPCKIPPLPEQQRIVGILDEAFEGIAIVKATSEKNLQNARALFESYLQSVFIQRGPDWMEKPLGHIASFRNGINYTKDSKGERVKIVGVRNFQTYYSAPLDDLDTVTVDGKLSELDSLRRDDILVVRSNGNIELIGRCILVGEVTEKISHSGFTIRIRLSDDEVLPRYLCHFMKSASSRKLLTEGGTGTNIKSLNQVMLSALAIPFPPISIQKVLVEKLESLSVETHRLATLYERKLAALDALKKSMLHQAFTGQLRATS